MLIVAEVAESTMGLCDGCLPFCLQVVCVLVRISGTEANP